MEESKFDSEKGAKMLQEITAWKEEHRESIESIRKDGGHAVVIVLKRALMLNPALFMFVATEMPTFVAIFEIGYVLGRTYQDVPEAFKSALK